MAVPSNLTLSRNQPKQRSNDGGLTRSDPSCQHGERTTVEGEIDIGDTGRGPLRHWLAVGIASLLLRWVGERQSPDVQPFQMVGP